MFRLFFIISGIFALLFAQSGMQMESIRSMGMGGASVAVADDAYGAATNPAGLIQLNRTQFSAAYTKFFAGLDVGSISEGSFFIAPRPFGKNTFSLAGSYLFQDIFSQMKLSISAGRRFIRFKNNIGFFSIAVSGDLYRVGYNLDNATYDEEHGDNPSDPLFTNYGENKMAFGAGVSAFAKYNKATFGLKVSDLNEPNISLNGASAGKLPRRMRAGFAYTYRDLILGAVDMDMPLRSATMQDPIKLAIGVEGRLFENKLFLRGGYDMGIGEGATGTVNFGLGFRSMTNHNFGFDYAIAIPTAHISGHPHHRFGVYYGLPIPPPKKIDLVVYGDSLKPVPNILRPDSMGTIHALVGNIGDDDAKNFWIRAFYFDEDSNYGLIEAKKIDILPANKNIDIDFNWTPPRKGYYNVYVSVNDLETKKAERKPGELPEINSSNNIAYIQVPAFNPPGMAESPKLLKNELKLNEINYIREEVPMVPFIFFDNVSSDVPVRFDVVLNEIAKRLKRNPNVAVRIKGYVDKPSEGGEVGNLATLAYARAEAVKNELIAKGVSAEQVIVVSTDEYDYTQPRAGKKRRRRTSAWEEKIAQENRRAEMETQIIGFPDTILVCCVNYRVGEVEIPPEGKLEVENSMRLTKDLLERNKDINILFHGMSSPEDGASWERAFDRAVRVRNYAGSLVSPKLARRMMVFASAPDSVDMVSIIMTGDAVIYRPRSSTKAAQGFQIAAREKNEIELNGIYSDAGIDSYYVAIVDDIGMEFRLLSAGKGQPPSSVVWNWLGNDGEPPEPGKNYHAYIYLIDKVGQTFEASSEPVRVNVTQTEKRQELIVVNFTFGGTFPQSPYLEGRMERIASDFIEKAVQRKSVFKVTVGGHTDIIGSPAVNQRLSLDRARREYRNIRRMLMSLLRLKDDKELDRWLAEQKVSIDVKGFGFSKPYVVRVWERGYFRNFTVGDNEYPEGRFINRRVSLEYNIIKRY